MLHHDGGDNDDDGGDDDIGNDDEGVENVYDGGGVAGIDYGDGVSDLGSDHINESGDDDGGLGDDGFEDGDGVPGPVGDNRVDPASDDDAVEEVSGKLAPTNSQSQCDHNFIAFW